MGLTLSRRTHIVEFFSLLSVLYRCFATGGDDAATAGMMMWDAAGAREPGVSVLSHFVASSFFPSLVSVSPRLKRAFEFPSIYFSRFE